MDILIHQQVKETREDAQNKQPVLSAYLQFIITGFSAVKCGACQSYAAFFIKYHFPRKVRNVHFIADLLYVTTMFE
jgi:hypothetical protein